MNCSCFMYVVSLWRKLPQVLAECYLTYHLLDFFDHYINSWYYNALVFIFPISSNRIFSVFCIFCLISFFSQMHAFSNTPSFCFIFIINLENFILLKQWFIPIYLVIIWYSSQGEIKKNFSFILSIAAKYVDHKDKILPLGWGTTTSSFSKA